MGYPYFSFTGWMKGEKKEIERVIERLELLFFTICNEDDDGNTFYVHESVEGDEVINNEHEQHLIELCESLSISTDGTDHILFLDKDGNLSLDSSDDGFDEEEPWLRLYPAISNVFPKVNFFFSTGISREYGAGNVWHAIINGNFYDSGFRNYENGGNSVAACLKNNFYYPEIKARVRLWEVEDGNDLKAIGKAREEYEKARQTTDLMEGIAFFGYNAWEEKSGKGTFDFTNTDISDWAFDDYFFATLLETVENNTLNDTSDSWEFPLSLEVITVINLNGCEEITMLPEAIIRCSNLTEINFAGTGIEKVPEWLRKMVGVKIITDDDDDD